MGTSLMQKNLIITPKKFYALLMLLSGTMAWFFLIGTSITKLLNLQSNQTTLYIEAIFFASSLTAVIGSQLSKKRHKERFLFLWIFAGVAATASLLTNEPMFQLLALLIVGISWALGLPYCLSLFANWTSPGERARVSGTLTLLTFGLVVTTLIAIRLLNLNAYEIILLGIVLRSLSFVALFFDNCENNGNNEPKKEKVRLIIHYRNFLLYLIPWLIFNAAIGLVNFVWIGLQTADYAVVGENANLLRFISFAISGFVAGFIADRNGRKPPIILGLVTLGMSFTFLGLATLSFNSIVSSAVTIYYITSGIAWGFLTTVYLAVLGDLPFLKEREAIYTVGIILPLLVFAGTSLMPVVLRVSVPAQYLSIVLSIMLFASVIPILYASETLPENYLQKRRMDNYLTKVSKILEENK